MSSTKQYAVSAAVQAMSAYQAGKPIEDLAREFGLDPANIIKLASNENPLGFSDKVQQALSETLSGQSRQALGRYPDANGFSLKAALSEHYGVPSDWITLGNGSNDLLELISLALLNEHTSCVYSQYAFVVYRLATQARGARHIQVPAKNFGHDLEAMLAAIDEDTRLVFIANPNNPTGTFHSGSVIEDFVARVFEKHGLNVTVVLDEAYNEYLDPENRFNSAALVKKYPNLVVLRTFSKAYGLAAIRVGFAIARPGLTDFFNRVRQPFNVNTFAQVAAQAALQDQEFLERTYALNKQGKQMLSEAFDKLGLNYVPSFGNFVLVHIPDALTINQELLRKGVIVRPVVGDGLPDHLRVSIGLPEENQRFIDALTEVLDQ